MQLGISTACFYPQKTEDALSFILSGGVKTTEIFFNSESELSRDFVASIKQQLDFAGAKLVAVHPFTSCYEPFLLFSEYRRRFDDGCDFYRRYFHTAAALGAKFVIIHGDREISPIDEKEYFERFSRLFIIAKEYGVILLQENVNLFRSQRPDFICRMSEYLGDNVRFCIDIKQCVRAKCTPHEMADAMGDKVLHVHFSDHSKDKSCLLPGNGDFDFVRFVEQNEHIKRCSGMVEVYNNSYDHAQQVVDSHALLEKRLAEHGFICYT